MSNKKLSATITIGGALAGSLASALGRTKDKVSDIGGAVRKLKNEQRMLGDNIQVFGKMGKNVDGLRAKYAAVTAEIGKAQRAQEKLKAATDQVAIGKTQMAGAGMALGGAGAVALSLGALIGKTAEFDYQMQMIGNTANLSGAQIKGLRSSIMDASKATGQSATELQKGFGFLLAAGMEASTAEKLIGTLGKTATASGAGIEDLAKAAFTLSDTMGISTGKNMEAALGTLAQAGKEGNVELKDMAKQLPVLGAGFSALKMGGIEAAATMGAALQIAKKGAADADEAANNMKNFIAKVMSPETLKKAQKNFGIDLYGIIKDAQQNGGNPFEASMQAIMKATKGDQKAIGELFGDMQVQNFVRPMMANWDKYKEIKAKALNTGGGVIDQDFAKIRATTKQQMTEVTNAFWALADKVGAALTPAFGQLLSCVKPVVDSLVGFFTAHQTAIAVVAKAAVTLGGLFVAFKSVAMGIGIVNFAWGILSKAMLTNPIGLAIAALATAAVLLYQNWEPIKAFFVGLWNGIVGGAKACFDWIADKVSAVGSAISTVVNLFRFGNSSGPATQAGALAGSGKTTPINIPPMATSKAMTKNTAANNTSITINAQSHQNPQSIAQQVGRELDKRRAQSKGNAMHDMAMGY